MAADLHIHTTASDGRLNPGEVVEQAVQAGLNCIAITDHDTVDGLKILMEENKEGLRIIPGIEFSTDLPQHEVHILGYYIDWCEDELCSCLERLAAGRQTRLRLMVDKINRLGYKIDYERVIEIAGNSVAVGRPHVAKALVEQGFFPSVNDVFKSLLRKNGPAYVPHYKFTPLEVINLIKKAGGFAVLAHPGLIGSDNIVAELIRLGLDGLEVYHPEHNTEQTEKYLQIAEKNSLFVTGGSDFHGIPGRFPPVLGIFTIDSNLVTRMERLRYKVQA
ncbi:PHP C-terminal domain protein [Thermosinus carboxydivorans Nor1]|uniref:PHP C-terminal domain protein n=1 Tax=Thermosinus carboxydivorans Nor1 TaxID=401526 RepID=A1HUD9_9FIRM|nr:PHP domain-containing protein [Thermosinus carboxydivorans]EAX46351.1 PHP C-terminal domain protein [Thermosinus carboxydivorans Nor1]